MFITRRWFKKLALIALLIGIMVLANGLNFLKRLGPMPCGYVSHTICSGMFISGRDYDDLYANDIPSLERRLTRTQVDGNVITTKFGFWPFDHISKSVYRPGLGCARLEGGSIADLQGPASLQPIAATPPRQLLKVA